jgi:hypothetical protein
MRASRCGSRTCTGCRARTRSRFPRPCPGDICAVAKIDELHFDAVLHDSHDEDHHHLKSIAFPPPMLGVAIEPQKRGEEQRLAEALHKLVAEDPCVRVEHHASVNETVLYGMGELHLRAMLERMTERYNVHVNTKPPSIPYRETITRPAEGHHRHKKQTGGAGQFGEVYLKIEPLERGAGFEFVDEVVGGTIPRQFIPAVEKGVRQALADGAIAGFPLQDLRVVVYEGKYHAVDSKEIAFVTAGRKAFLDAVGKAGATVLEPVVQGRDHRAGELGRRHHRRPRDQAGAHQRQRLAVRRTHVGVGAGAARRAVRLPDPPEGADGRRGQLRRGLQPLRPGAAAAAAGADGGLEAEGGGGVGLTAARARCRPYSPRRTYSRHPVLAEHVAGDLDHDVVGVHVRVVGVALEALQAGRAGRQDLHLAVEAVLRSAFAPLTISCSLRKRTCVETSGRATAKVPDSPQQRSFFSTLPLASAFISVFTTVSGSWLFIGVWQGSWYM